jgi:hypothetical protein
MRPGDDWRYTVGVAAEIAENLLRATKGWFAVDHPVVAEEGAEERSESLRFHQKLKVPIEAEFTVGEGPLESIYELATEDPTQNFHGEEEAIAGFDPAPVIRGDTAGRDHTMEMGVMLQPLIPAVEHAVRPSARYSCFESALRSSRGNTASITLAGFGGQIHFKMRFPMNNAAKISPTASAIFAGRTTRAIGVADVSFGALPPANSISRWRRCRSAFKSEAV